MNTPLPDLGELLHDAVADVEPADRLDEIRSRVGVAPTRAARPWWYAAGGVVLATAAAVTAFAVVGGGDDPAPDDHDHDVATSPGTQLVAAYFIGDGPRGERLFREFDEVAGDDPLQAALDRIEQAPSDPDYRTPWTVGSFGEVIREDDGIHVELGDAAIDDDLAVQQVVYTLQAAAGQRVPVWLDDPTGATPDVQYSAQPMNEVLSLMSISDPAEGSSYDAPFIARGRANVYEGTVVWEVRDEAGETVAEGFTTATGSMDRLYPWQVRVDISGLAPGSYTFVAAGTDPSGGAELSRLDHDTRTITVR